MTTLDFLEEPAPPRRARLSAGTIVLICGMVAVTLVLAVQLARQNAVQPRPGELAPDFTLTTFDGETVRLSDLRGQLVLINFWGSWCPPCEYEAPDLQDAYEQYRDYGFTIIGVNRLEAPSAALAFIERHGLTFRNGPDIQETITNTYRLQGTPENFLVGRDGRVVAAWLGPVTFAALTRELDRVLAEERA